ncbi:MAG: hypothetical protein ACJ8DH_05350 [Microvirga sp.]
MLRRTLLAAGLLGAGLAPASAQWFGGLGGYAEGPLPPTAIMRSLMQRGFIEIGRPRFDGAVYVVEGVNARGMRLRLVIDAFDGGVISRTRLDAPLLPPADVGRDRAARAAPLRGELEPDFDDDLAPRGPGRNLGQDFGRERIDRSDLPPLPGPRRAERIEPPLAGPPGAEPPRPLPPNAAVRPAEPRPSVGAEPPRRREAKKPDPAGRQPATAVPGKPKPATEPQAVPPAPTAPVEAAKPAPSPPTAAAPPVSAPAPAAPAASEKPAEAPQRTVRVIDGVAPVVPQASTAPKAAEEPKSEITPPAALD